MKITTYLLANTFEELNDMLLHMGYELETCFREELTNYHNCLAYRKYDGYQHVVEFVEGRGYKIYKSEVA